MTKQNYHERVGEVYLSLLLGGLMHPRSLATNEIAIERLLMFAVF